MRRRVSWAGFPRAVHNRKEVSKFLASHGVEMFYAPLEIPSAIGKVERHQAILKATLRKTIHDTEAVGKDAFEVCLHERTSVKNQMQRVQGYSPVHWVLKRNPRIPGSITDMEEAGNLCIFKPSYHLRHASRTAAQKAFVHVDTSSRVVRALTRHAAVQNKKTFVVGDLVVYRRDPQMVEPCDPLPRVIGVDPHTMVFGCCMKECLFCVAMEHSDQPMRVNLWHT